MRNLVQRKRSVRNQQVCVVSPRPQLSDRPCGVTGKLSASLTTATVESCGSMEESLCADLKPSVGDKALIVQRPFTLKLLATLTLLAATEAFANSKPSSNATSNHRNQNGVATTNSVRISMKTVRTWQRNISPTITIMSVQWRAAPALQNHSFGCFGVICWNRRAHLDIVRLSETAMNSRDGTRLWIEYLTCPQTTSLSLSPP